MSDMGVSRMDSNQTAQVSGNAFAQNTGIGNTGSAQPVVPAQNTDQANNFPQKPTLEQVERSIARMNIASQMANTHLKFEMHDDATHPVVVKIINDQTGDVLQQIPSDELLKLDEQMRSTLGVFFDKRI